MVIVGTIYNKIVSVWDRAGVLAESNILWFELDFEWMELYANIVYSNTLIVDTY